MLKSGGGFTVMEIGRPWLIAPLVPTTTIPKVPVGVVLLVAMISAAPAVPFGGTSTAVGLNDGRGCPSRSCRSVRAGNSSYATFSFDDCGRDSRPRIVARAQRSLWPSILRKCFSVSSQADATQRSAMS